MEMVVHLHPEVFDIVLDGVKDVEIRVNDEKRKQLKVGDTLKFLKRPDDVDYVIAEINDLKYFKNFDEVVDNYPMSRIYLEDTAKDEYLKLMNKFYSEEEVSSNGVVAIEFKLIK